MSNHDKGKYQAGKSEESELDEVISVGGVEESEDTVTALLTPPALPMRSGHPES